MTTMPKKRSASNNSARPVVSVMCITYNQRDYIARCLDSLLSQETSFPYEVLVNDDCSTDGTDGIVLSYQDRFPDRVKVITHKTNHYSQGRFPIEHFLSPIAEGKYFALCEGDDYWTDSSKLQRQYDVMESNPLLTACVHASENVRANTGKRITTLRFYDSDRLVDPADVLSNGQCFSTNSLFVRADAMRSYFSSTIRPLADDGDHKLMAYFAIKEGGMYYIDRIMSAYRILAKNSINRSFLLERDRDELALKKMTARIELLHEIDRMTEGRYHAAVERGSSCMRYIYCKDTRDYRSLVRDWRDRFSRESLPTRLDSFLYTYCPLLHSLACWLYFHA